MLSEIKGWYYAWKSTLRLMIFDRETYRRLKEPFEIGNFTEAGSPEQVLRRHEGQTMESYLEWLENTPDLPEGTAGFGELDFEHGASGSRFGSDEVE